MKNSCKFLSLLFLLFFVMGLSVTGVLAEETVNDALGEATLSASGDWILDSQVPSGAVIVEEKWTYDQKTYQESQSTSLSGWTLESSYWQKSSSGSFNYASFPASKYYSTSDKYYKSYQKAAYSSYENTTAKRVASNKANGYIFYHYAFPDSYSDGDNLIGEYYGEWGPAHTTQATIWESFYSTSAGTASSYRDSTGTRIVYKFPGHSNNHSYWWFRLDVRQCTYTDYVKIFKYYKVESKESSTKVTASDTITNVKHWVRIKSSTTIPELSSFTYSFSNSRSGFGYSAGYRIPLARFQMIFGNNSFSKMLYNREGEWGGNCYGMSATGGMFCQSGNDTLTSNFKSGVAVPSGLAVGDYYSAWNVSLKQFIESMQVSQYASSISATITKNKNLKKVCSAVKTFQQNGTNPVMICIYGPEGGHALIGYKIVSSSSSEDRIKVYDPNYPNQDRDITVYKNSSGDYTGWFYYMNNSYFWGSNFKGCSISYVPYAEYYKIWTQRSQQRSLNDTMNLLSFNSESAEITDIEGKTIATVKEGEVITDNPEIVKLEYLGITSDNEGINNGETLVWVPTDLYTIQNTDSDVKDFHVSMTNVDQSVEVTTNANTVTLAADDGNELNYAQIEEKGKTYEIKLCSSLKDAVAEIELSGSSDTNATALAQILGTIYVSGADFDDNTTLTVNGTTVSGDSVNTGNDLNGMVSDIVIQNQVAFVDVPEKEYYHASVYWAAKKGITKGTDKSHFSPNSTCTRSQVVTFLWRAMGQPEPTSTKNPFSDVKKDAYYYKAVLWAVENGITTGTSATKFSPDAGCTRGQVVTFLYRAEGSPVVNGSNPFKDVSADDYYYNAVLWASDIGVTSGTSATTFSPDATCTRGQIVTFLYRDMV